MIYHPGGNKDARYVVEWAGNVEDDYKVVDIQSKEVVKTFNIYETPRPFTAALNYAITLENTASALDKGN